MGVYITRAQVMVTMTLMSESGKVSDSSEEETYVHRIRHEQSKLKNGISLIL